MFTKTTQKGRAAIRRGPQGVNARRFQLLVVWSTLRGDSHSRAWAAAQAGPQVEGDV